MPISLDQVEYTNFRSFLGTHTINFDKTGLCLIRGSNEDTGGESGAGKTSVILGISYLLGVASYSTKEMQCWLTEEPMHVRGHFTTPDGPLVITRGTKKLVVEYKGEKTTGKEAEPLLDRIFGVSATMRGVLTYRAQKEPGFFLNMTDGEKKEFLTELLGLVSVESAITSATDQAKELKDVVTRLQSSYDTLTESFQTFLAAKPNLINHEKEIAEQLVLVETTNLEITNLSKELADSSSLYSYVKNGIRRFHSLKIAHLDRQKAKIQETPGIGAEERENLNEKRSKILERLSVMVKEDDLNKKNLIIERQHALNKIKENKAELATNKKELEKLLLHQKELATGNCYVCGSQYSDSKAKHAENEVRIAELNDRQKLIASAPLELDESLYVFAPNPMIEKFGTAAYDLGVKIDQSYSEDKNQLASLLAPIQTEIAAHNDLILTTLNGLDESQHAAYGKKSKYIGDLRSQNLAVSLEMQKLIQEQEYFCRSMKKWGESHAQLSQRLQGITENLNEATVDLNKELDFVDAMKGFLDRIFQEVLEQIASESNAMIGTLPNVAHLSIEFKTEKSTQKGVVKQSITPVVYFKGSERPLKSGCSGGMYTSIELAVDWAVNRVIEQRTACSFNWLLLDEPFTGLDNITKENCLEVLQRIAADKLIVVVDHDSILKETFSQVINVLYKDEHSVIVPQ